MFMLYADAKPTREITSIDHQAYDKVVIHEI